MAKTVQSRKAKGRRLQQLVRDCIVRMFVLHVDDVRSASMGSGGVDVILSPKAQEAFPYSVECKAQEGFAKVYEAFNQAGDNAYKGTTPAVVLKSNNKEPLVVISLETFMNLAQSDYVRRISAAKTAG